MKTALALCLSVTLYSISFAQTSFTINGRILDAITSEPVIGANIQGDNASAVSDTDGKFVLKNLPEDTHRFTITHIGYEPETLTVQVTSETEEIVVKLAESTTILEELQVLAKSESREFKELSTVSLNISKEFLEQNRENSLMQTLRKVPGVSTIILSL